jgi:hypothetical protein
MAVAAVEKEMFPPLTVADIQAEFDRVNAGVPCVADKSDALSDKVRPGLVSGAAMFGGAVLGGGSAGLHKSPYPTDADTMHDAVAWHQRQNEEMKAWRANVDRALNKLCERESERRKLDAQSPGDIALESCCRIPGPRKAEETVRSAMGDLADVIHNRLKLSEAAERAYQSLVDKGLISSVRVVGIDWGGSIDPAAEVAKLSKEDLKVMDETLHKERQKLRGDYQKGDMHFTKHGERLRASKPDNIDHLKKLTDTLQLADGELRTGGINKQVDQLKMHMAARLDFSPGGSPASSKQVGGTHYKDLAIQPVEYCQRNNLGFCESSVVKYVTRHKAKAGVEDLKKARHFIDLLIEMTEKDVNKATYCEDVRH